MTDIQVLKKQLKDGVFDERLAEIYGTAEKQRARYLNSLERYEELFSGDEVEIYSAPGRTEIGGNHTDHQHGMVLAASIDLDTIAVAAPNDENVIELVSEGYKPIRVEPAQNVSDHMKPDESEYGTTAALIKGEA